MKYRDTKESSSEVLRMVIALMAKQSAAYHPVSYTVWYEYASGRNPRLKEALDTLLATGAGLDDQTIQEFFDKYIAERDEEALRQLYAEFRRIISEASESASEAGTQAQQYGDSLAQIGRRLAAGADLSSLKAIVEGLVTETLQMHSSVAALEKQLAEHHREVENLRTAVMEVQSEAYTDPMTSLLNRRGFEKAINEVFGAGNPDRAETCLLVADIDHFKNINDTHGHLLGDNVICAVAQALKNSVKGRDTVARFGGEEFVVLLTKTPLAGARAVAEQVRTTIEQGRIRRGDASIGAVTISVGVAAYRDGETIADFIHRADLALYASKQNGRNRVTLAGET